MQKLPLDNNEQAPDQTSKSVPTTGCDENKILDYRVSESLTRTWDDIGVGMVLIVIGMISFFESLVGFIGRYEDLAIVEPSYFVLTAVGIIMCWFGIRRLKVKGRQ